jgi:flavin reductase (DIM6/NTAB) family NADH-FMN oxidoreductase RutF
MSNAPPVIHITSAGEKDTLRNIRATGEFVVNVVSRDLVAQMNLTAADFPADEDEFGWAELDRTASSVVKPPRVARARAALECTLRQVLEIGNGRMVFGDVVRIHTAPGLWEGDEIPPERLDAVGRLGGSAYQMIDGVHRLERPTWEDVRAT